VIAERARVAVVARGSVWFRAIGALAGEAAPRGLVALVRGSVTDDRDALAMPEPVAEIGRRARVLIVTGSELILAIRGTAITVRIVSVVALFYAIDGSIAADVTPRRRCDGGSRQEEKKAQQEA